MCTNAKTDQLLDVSEIRRQIKADLPATAFGRAPEQGVIMIVVNMVVLGIFFLMVKYSPSWYVGLAASVVLGQCFATLAFLAHDAMHGSIVANAKVQKCLGYLGFYPFFISPYLWRYWHVKAHHGRTNSPCDPDVIMNKEEHQGSRFARFYVNLIPSESTRFAGIFFFLYWFTIQGQHVLWGSFFNIRWELGGFSSDRKKAVRDTAIYLGLWTGVALIAGAYISVFIIILPMFIGNTIIMLFIVSQHTYRPRVNEGGENHPLKNTVSVRVPRWLDVINIHFSRHVEHHLFPSMSHKYLPLVTDWLRNNLKEHYLNPSIVDSTKIVFGTPRVYENNRYLNSPGDDSSRRIDTMAISRLLRNRY